MWQVFVAYEAIIDQVNHKCTLVTSSAKWYSPVIFVTFVSNTMITKSGVIAKLQSGTVLYSTINEAMLHTNWSMNHIKPHNTHNTRTLHFWLHTWDCLVRLVMHVTFDPRASVLSPVSSRQKKKKTVHMDFLPETYLRCHSEGGRKWYCVIQPLQL